MLLWSFLAAPLVCAAQLTDFEVAWVVIGDAAAANNKGRARAGRQLFMASDLLALSLQNVKVVRVSAEPVVMEIGVGQQICVSSLDIRAFGPDQQRIAGAPLSISVRQDHRDRLSLKRSKQDICVRPQDAGEYPLRLTSLIPAPDGSIRGAQIFLRVKDLPARQSAAEAPH